MAEKHRLTKLSVDELSLVDSPANRGARVVLLKREEKGGIMDTEIERASLLKRLAGYLGVKTPEVETEDEEITDMADEALQKKLDEVTKALDEVTKAKDAAVKQAADLKADSDKRAAAAAKAAEDDAAEKQFRDGLSPILKKAMDEMTPEERKAWVERMKKPDADPMAKALEAAVKFNTDQAARIEKLERADRIAKRKDELKDLDGHVEKFSDFVEAYDALEAKDKDAAALVLKSTRALAAQAKAAGLFAVLGKDGQGAGDAEAEIDKAAKAAKAADPKLTDAEAVTKALTDNPELYDRALAEKE